MRNDLNKNMGELHWPKTILRYLSYRCTGTIFTDVRDEVGTVFPLEFPECKGTHLRMSKPEYLLTTPNRLVSHPSVPKDIATSKSSQRKDLCRKRPSQKRRMDRYKLQRESAPQNRSKPAPSRFSITNLPTYNYRSTPKTSSSPLRNSDSSTPGSAPSSNISSLSSSPSGPATPERASSSHL